MQTLRVPPGGGGIIELDRIFGLKAVEAYEYTPYGIPTVHYKDGAMVRTVVWDDDKDTVTTTSSVTSNTRRGEFADAAYLTMSDSPFGASSFDKGRVRNSAAMSRIGIKHLYMARPWIPVGEVYHIRARWYSPFEGRFITLDPIGYAGGASQYMYCMGDSIDFIDPFGEAPLDWGIWLQEWSEPLEVKAARYGTGPISNVIGFGGYYMASSVTAVGDMLQVGTGLHAACSGYDMSGRKLSTLERSEHLSGDIFRGVAIGASVYGVGRGFDRMAFGSRRNRFLYDGWEKSRGEILILAEKNGGRMLANTPAGRFATTLDNAMGKSGMSSELRGGVSNRMWDHMSRHYARTARGRTFIAPLGKNPNSVLRRVEMPELMNNSCADVRYVAREYFEALGWHQ
ncbi:MAG: RHS repeat-associated core domain-containing protein [Candidatus Sumerlaeia bacterium]|nr:RHS repeat-associated core domain-containing protein [Candidatus Sumerlaeia bacterium]